MKNKNQKSKAENRKVGNLYLKIACCEERAVKRIFLIETKFAPFAGGVEFLFSVFCFQSARG